MYRFTVLQVKDLVSRGQLTFVNGGWVQHDEATSHFSMMTDQTTRGHDFLLRTFNFTPSIAWQIDPFGHSNTQVRLRICSGAPSQTQWLLRKAKQSTSKCFR